jgi:outer membrane murein-binding lipoprotein Lpp
MSEDLTQNLHGSQNDALAQILSAVQNLGTRVDSLEKKVEERLYDTRPVWEKVVQDIGQLQEGQTRLQTDVTQLQSNVTQLREGQDSLRGEVNTGLRDINRKFSIFNDTLTQMQADYRDIYDRVRDLERQRT